MWSSTHTYEKNGSWSRSVKGDSDTGTLARHEKIRLRCRTHRSGLVAGPPERYAIPTTVPCRHDPLKYGASDEATGMCRNAPFVVK